MVNACTDPEFLSERGIGRGGKPNAEKTAMIFYVCLFVFFGPKFSGDAGGPTINGGGGGGGVQMLISIEFVRTCDLPGMGVRTP